MTLADHSIEKLLNNSNDTNPMWLGNTIYFLSDRNHMVNLFAYRTDTKQLTQLTRHDDFDVMNASAALTQSSTNRRAMCICSIQRQGRRADSTSR